MADGMHSCREFVDSGSGTEDVDKILRGIDVDLAVSGESQSQTVSEKVRCQQAKPICRAFVRSTVAYISETCISLGWSNVHR